MPDFIFQQESLSGIFFGLTLYVFYRRNQGPIFGLPYPKLLVIFSTASAVSFLGVPYFLFGTSPADYVAQFQKLPSELRFITFITFHLNAFGSYLFFMFLFPAKKRTPQ